MLLKLSIWFNGALDSYAMTCSEHARFKTVTAVDVVHVLMRHCTGLEARVRVSCVTLNGVI